MQTLAPSSSRFDASVRAFSLLSLVAALGVLFVRFVPPEGGIQFSTHILLIIGFFAQLALLLLFSVIALVLRVRGRLRCSRLSACLSTLVLAGLVGQFYAVQTVAVDGSSVP
jgi:hypothetical protein